MTATTWNPSDADAHFVFSGGNLTATGSTGLTAYKSCRATTSKSSGKYYFEVKIGVIGSGQTGFGMGLASAALTNYIGSGTNNGFSIFSGGNFFVNGASTSVFGSGVTANTIVGCAVDITNGLVWFKGVAVSLTAWNAQSGGTADPATGTGGKSFTASGALFPSLSFSSSIDQETGNFGPSGFAGTVPSGFSSWDASAAFDATKMFLVL